MTVGPNENRTGAADAAVLQPCKADVDQIDIAHPDPGSVERDALSDSGLLGCLDPLMAVLAGDQSEVAAMDESAQREADEALKDTFQREAHMGFPSVPEDITSVDIRRATPDQIKFWMKKFGSANVTARLRGVA